MSNPTEPIQARMTARPDMSTAAAERGVAFLCTSAGYRGKPTPPILKTRATRRPSPAADQAKFWFKLPLYVLQDVNEPGAARKIVFERILGRSLNPSQLDRFSWKTAVIRDGDIYAWVLRSGFFELRDFTRSMRPYHELSERDARIFEVEEELLSLYRSAQSSGESARVMILKQALAIRSLDDVGRFATALALEDFDLIGEVVRNIARLDDAAMDRFLDTFVNRKKHFDDRRLFQLKFPPLPPRADFGARAATRPNVALWRRHVNAFNQYLMSIFDRSRADTEEQTATLRNFSELKQRLDDEGLVRSYYQYKAHTSPVQGLTNMLRSTPADRMFRFGDPVSALNIRRLAVTSRLRASGFASIAAYEQDIAQFQSAFIQLSEGIIHKMLRNSQLLLLNRPGLGDLGALATELRKLDLNVWRKHRNRILRSVGSNADWIKLRKQYRSIKDRHPTVMYDGIDWIELAHLTREQGYHFDRAVDAHINGAVAALDRVIKAFEDSPEAFIYRANVLLGHLKQQLGISGVPALETILRKRREELADRKLFQLVVEILIALALSILTFGSGFAAFVARLGNVALSLYDLRGSLDDYALDKLLSDQGLSTNSPSVAWIVADVVFLSLDVGDLKKLLVAAKKLDETGKLDEFTRVLDKLEAIEYTKRAHIERLAATKNSMKRALDDLVAGGSVAAANRALDPQMYLAAYKIAKGVLSGSITTFELFMLEIRKILAQRRLEKLTERELEEFHRTYDEILAQKGDLEDELRFDIRHSESLAEDGTAIYLHTREIFGSERAKALYDGFEAINAYVPTAVLQVLGRTTGKARLDKKLARLEKEIESIMKHNGTHLSREQGRKVARMIKSAHRIARKRWNDLRPRLWRELYNEPEVNRILHELEAKKLITLPENYRTTGQAPRAIADHRDGLIHIKSKQGLSVSEIAQELNVSAEFVTRRKKEIKNIIKQAEEALEDISDRKIWRLHQEGLTPEQIARDMEESEAYVGERIGRIGRKVRRAELLDKPKIELPLNLDHITPIERNPFKVFSPHNLRVISASFNDTYLRLFQFYSPFAMTLDPLEEWLLALYRRGYFDA